jgi:hypothetical protein
MSSYANVKRAPLKLKGAPSKRQKVSSEEQLIDQTSATLSCTGRVVVSGTTIQGLETKFKEEIEIGDTIIILNPQTHKLEERVVTVVMTNRSLMISEKLSSDFVSTVTMDVRKDSIKLRRQVEADRRLQERAQLKKEEFDDDDGEVAAEKPEPIEEAIKRQLQKNLQEAKMNVSYKEKTGTWGYKVVSEKVDTSRSREDLLDLRAKKVHDKYC